MENLDDDCTRNVTFGIDGLCSVLRKKVWIDIFISIYLLLFQYIYYQYIYSTINQRAIGALLLDAG